MRKKILITGGSGFIGINTIHKLLKTSDCVLYILNHSNHVDLNSLLIEEKYHRRMNFIHGDILNPQIIKNAIKNADIVIHMAASIKSSYPFTNVHPMVETNVVGTTILLESLYKHPVEKFILLSSSGVYGTNRQGVPIDEHHPFNPVSPYTASKLACDYIARSFCYSGDIPVTIIRPFNVYGPFQKVTQMIPLFITKFLKKQKIVLNQGGLPTRDWIYVDDVAQAISLIVKAPIKKVAGEIFNIGTGIETSVLEVARMILKEFFLDDSYLSFSSHSPKEVLRNVGDSTYIQKILGWRPKYLLKDGVKQTVNWYKNCHSPQSK